MLRALDNLWVEHLEAMQHLRVGIGLQGYGQRGPLVEYKKEGFALFSQLLASIQKQVVYSIYKIHGVAQMGPSVLERAKQILTAPAKTADAARKAFSTGENGNGSLVHTAGKAFDEIHQLTSRVLPNQSALPREPEERPKDDSGNKVGRNVLCPCGSGLSISVVTGRDNA